MKTVLLKLIIISIFNLVLCQAIGEYSWIKKWAAIGDSFTAGIGSGDGLYREDPITKCCSRWNHTYPTILNKVFGPSVERFTYSACSRAGMSDIQKQALTLKHEQNLIVLTAGGNELGLVSKSPPVKPSFALIT
jgi:hypothetical protein